MFAAAILTCAVAFRDGVVISSDPAAPRPALVLVLLPALLLIAAITFAPPRPLRRAGADPAAEARAPEESASQRRAAPAGVELVRPRRAALEAGLLLLIAAAFPLLVPLLPLPEDYILLKLAMLLVLAPLLMLAMARLGGGASLRWDRPGIGAVWMLVPVAVALIADGVRAQASFPALAAYPTGALVVGAVATALTAGIGEEVFYRRLLQTRLEALLGRWSGILLAAVVFALMHLPSHGLAAGLGLGTAQVLAVQGLFGIACGWAWSRYRRLWVSILVHLSVNGTAVVLFLVLGGA